MIPGRRTTNLILVLRKETSEGDWNPAERWVEDRQVWASIDPNRGREVFRAAELEAVVTHTIRGDFLELEGIDETFIVLYNDTAEYAPPRQDSLIFDLIGVMPDYDGRGDIMIQANLKGRRLGATQMEIEGRVGNYLTLDGSPIVLGGDFVVVGD